MYIMMNIFCRFRIQTQQSSELEDMKAEINPDCNDSALAAYSEKSKIEQATHCLQF